MVHQVTPKEAFDKLRRWAFLDASGRFGKPGDLLRHLTVEEREALKRLTSADAASYRPDAP